MDASVLIAMEWSMSGKYNSNFSNHWSNDLVGVDLNFTNNSTGKKVFDWPVTVVGMRERIIVEIKAYQTGDGQVEFGASSQYIPGGVRNSDINLLKDEVKRLVSEQVTLLTKIEWEDWFEVIVDGANSDFSDSRFSALGANLKLQVNRLKRGVDPTTGRVLTIVNGAAVDFPEPTRFEDGDEPTVGSIMTRVKFGRSAAERSYIPATDANRRAIDDILARMELLRNSIAGLLSQDKIEATLVADTFKALPKP